MSNVLFPSNFQDVQRDDALKPEPKARATFRNVSVACEASRTSLKKIIPNAENLFVALIAVLKPLCI
jgi:hypothetical protein